MCVASHFALFEVAAIVASATLHAELELVDRSEPRFEPSISLRCAEGLRVRVRSVRREDPATA